MGITLNQLTNTISKVTKKLREEFTHSNISVLDKLSTSNNGYLLYDDKQVAGSGVLLRDETVLFTGEANAVNDYELADSVKNYDEIYVCARLYTSSNLNSNTIIINTNDIDIINNYDAHIFEINSRVIGFNFSKGYNILTVTNIQNNSSSSIAITKIVGIRYKQTQNTTVLWEGNQSTAGTLDLYDDYTNYEHLVLIFGNGAWKDGGVTSIWYINEQYAHNVTTTQSSNYIWYCLHRLDDTKQIDIKISSSATGGVGYWNAKDCPLVKIIGIRETLPTDREVVTDAQVLSEIETTIALLNTEEGTE